jgi:hypothetical protein
MHTVYLYQRMYKNVDTKAFVSVSFRKEADGFSDRAWQHYHTHFTHSFAERLAQHHIFCHGVDLISYFMGY